MKKIWPMLGLGLGAYILFALMTLPAHLITNRLTGAGMSIAGVEGTVWRGSAQTLQIANTNLGILKWNLRPLALFMLQVSVDVEMTRADGSVNCRVGVRPFSGRINLDKLTASLPISALPATVTQGGGEAGMQHRCRVERGDDLLRGQGCHPSRPSTRSAKRSASA